MHALTQKQVSNRKMDLIDRRICINELPGEVLGEILALSIGDKRPRRDIYCVELTCRQWREPVEGTPLCWTNVTATEGMDYVRQALRKSGDASIDLLWDAWKSDGDFSEFIAEVDPHIRRWRSVTIYVEVRPDALGQLETTEAPRLEKLHLSQTSGLPWFANPLTLFGGQGFPSKVRDVLFEGFSVIIHPPNLPSLVSLTLKDVESFLHCNITDILSTSPHLEYLELDNIPDLSPPETCKPAIHLDALNFIILQGLNPLVVSFILWTIRVPRCRSLTIRCGLGSGSSAQVLLTPDLSHLHSAIQVMARTAKSIEIDRYGAGRHILTVGDFKLILESEEEDKLQEAFRLLTLALGPVGPTLGVRLALDDRGPDSFCLEPQFSSRITELELFGPSKGSILPNWVIAKLRQPLEMDPTQWALRQLKAIDIRLGIECMEELAEMLVARYGSVDAFDGNSIEGQSKGTRRPSPLTEIHFWYIPNSVEEEDQQRRWFMQVHKAIPTTKIFWGGELQQFDEYH